MNGQNLINRMQYIEITIGVLLRDEERKREGYKSLECSCKKSNEIIRKVMIYSMILTEYFIP